MLKIKFENLLVILVLSLIVGYDVIMTSVLNKTLPQLPTILLIGVVLVLSLRFLFIKNFSISFIVSGILLIVTSLCVFLQTGATNFLLYSLLILLLYDVDVDVMTAGEFKRTVTVLGENTEKGKQKFQQELEETHQLFKQFVSQNRPCVDIDKIATGEHWFGQQAIDLKLVDEISTSDDLILEKMKEKHVLSVKYRLKKSLIKKLGRQAEESAVNIVHRYTTKPSNNFIH